MTNLHANAVRVIEETDPLNPLPVGPDGKRLTDQGYVAHRADPNGNTIFDGEYFYQYDAWNRLLQVNEKGSLTSAMFDATGSLPSEGPGAVDPEDIGPVLKHHAYDGLGRLVRTASPIPGGTTPTGGAAIVTERFYYDGIRRIQEVMTNPLSSMENMAFAQQSGLGTVLGEILAEQGAAAGGGGGISGGGVDGNIAALGYEQAQMELGQMSSMSGGGEGGGEEEMPTAGTTLAREYIWGPGDRGTDELLVQFDTTGKAWYVIQDGGGDVSAVVQPAVTSGGSTPARVVAQYVYDPYGAEIHVEHLFAQVLDVLEDRHAPTSTASISTFTPDSETQFMWGVRDKDELLQVRTRALTDANGVVHNPVKLWTDNGFVNTVYALSDAQMSVAGYVSASGRARESRLYDSYGRMTRTLLGDLNGDGVCDDADYLIFDASYNVLDCSSPNMPGRNVGEGPLGGGYAPTWGCPADLNGDWIVDDADFNIFAASYNQLVPEVDTLTSGNANGGALEWGPGWNGYWFDPATGLWLSRNRWYDPEGGRWITRDPAGYVDGLSLYLYVKGNPFLYRDPSGLWGIVDSWNAVTGAVNTAGNWVGTQVGDGVFNAAQAFGPAGQGAATTAAIAEGASAGATKGAIYVAAGAVAVAAAPEGAIASGVTIGLGALGTYGSYQAGVGINEAFTGEDASTGEALSTRDRAERGATGAVAVATLGVGLKTSRTNTTKTVAEEGPATTPPTVNEPTAPSQRYVEITSNGQRVKGYGPKVPYDRTAAYGNTPTAADRALGKTDHQPPLVQRYYDGDPAANELPGFLQTSAERAASAADPSRLVAPATNYRSQGGQLRKYSLEKRKCYFGY